MAELQSLIDREMERAGLPSFSLGDIARRRDRKRRNQRVGSAVLAVIIAVAAIGGLLAAFRKGERHAPAAPSITPGNVSDLRLLGSVPFGGSFAASDGLVYVVDGEAHELEAYPMSCYAVEDPCTPKWIAHLSGTPAVIGAAGGNVYVSTDAVYAFSATCGTRGATCRPMWIGSIPKPQC